MLTTMEAQRQRQQSQEESGTSSCSISFHLIFDSVEMQMKVNKFCWQTNGTKEIYHTEN